MIYVETEIRCDMEKVWEHTQNPALHQRWDLRFSAIEYLPRQDERQRFRYSTRLGFGLKIEGEGETVGERLADRSRTSALKFWSPDSKSLILEGSGYWKYVPTVEGISFSTGYDYQTRFGTMGSAFDRTVFRPLIGWATAWSFDALRLWLEHDIPPEISLRATAAHALARGSLALAWIYQGLVPKLLFPQIEVSNMQAAGFDSPLAMVRIIGVFELGLGLALVVLWRWRGLLLFQVLVLLAATIGSMISMRFLYIQPFNPATLNLTMIALGIVGWLAADGLPTARRCKRKP